MIVVTSNAPATSQQISDTVSLVLGAKLKSINVALGEVTAIVNASDYLAAATLLRDSSGCKFEQLLIFAALTIQSTGMANTRACVIAWQCICCRSA